MGPSQKQYTVLHSEQDASVNFVRDMPVGMLEARYVQRTDEYLIAYLSSQTACRFACRFCHLTATGQNKYEDTTVQQFLEQADEVLGHFDMLDKPAERVHYNFMARGEPLHNEHLINHSSKVLRPLAQRAIDRGLGYRFLISTIMPETFRDLELTDLFPEPELFPEIFYSLYSVDERFRKRWLPRAMNPIVALGKLKRWQEATGKVPKIHFAFIEGENDSEHSVRGVCAAINEVGLKVNFNIVRYNPPENTKSRESAIEVIDANVALMNELLKPELSCIVPRVGKDVAASCGMFIEKGAPLD